MAKFYYTDPPLIRHHYHPRSKASEGYVFTSICHSVILRGGGVTPNASWDRSHGHGGGVVTWLGGGVVTWPGGGGRSGLHLPPWPGSKVTTSPPRQHLPPPGQHLPPLDNNSLPPGQHLPPPWTTPPSPLDNTSLPPRPGSKVTTPPLPPGQYASYWNAFLLT